MPDDSEAADDTSDIPEGERGTDIVRTRIESNPATAEYDLLEIVAELEGREIEELPSFYTQVDHFVEHLFKNPPSPEAQMQIEFSYAGYRITLTQRGEVTLVNVKRTLDE
jgi:hypothetical protein